MKIQAYMGVYNEADVLPWVLDYMSHQGVDVHVLDGWSTDASYEIAQAAFTVGVTVERYPADPAAAPQFVYRGFLHHVEDLAEASGADWCMLSDADEWRSSNRPGETLAEGLERLDTAGWTLVDHQVRTFLCTDDGWHGQCPPPDYFHYYAPRESDMLARLPNVKTWKNIGRVRLAPSGGHIAVLPRNRMPAEKFRLDHYPYRNPAQAAAKLASRLARRCEEEHRQGWGVHYDEQFPAGFLWDPKALICS